MRAYRRDLSGHDVAERWLADSLADGAGGVAISELALSAVIRIVSNPGTAKVPPDKDRLLAFTDAIVRHPNVWLVSPGTRHWRIFHSLRSAPGVHGTVVPDAYYAAMAI